MKETAKEKDIQENKKGKEKKKKKHIVLKIFLVLVLILVIAGVIFLVKVKQNGGGIQGVIKTSLGHDENTVNQLDKIYCLLLGQSQNLTDTIMLASYDPKTQEAALLSIPRDTFIGTSQDYASGYDKINAVYQTGVENLLEDVREITGIDVQYYLKVDTEALKVLVDEIGGVYFDVPIDMYYTDKGQGLYINLKAGYQLLDGDKAEQLVRFRHNSDGSTYPTEYGGEDLGRIRTQRAFLKELLDQTIEKMDINMIFSFLDIAEQYVETNLDFDAIKDYVPYIIDFDVDTLKSATLPGTSLQAAYTGTWIYIVDEEETQEVIDELFYGKTTTTTTEDENGNTVETGNTVTSGYSNYDDYITVDKVTIEIINGSGNSSKVTEITNELEAAGYTVINSGSTTTVSKTTAIIRSDVEEDDETTIKEIIDIENFVSGESGKADITIIVGTDYIA